MKQPKFKTTLYLEEESRKKLEKIPKGERTILINKAILDLLEKEEKKIKKQKLLKGLDNPVIFKSLKKSREIIEEDRKTRSSRK